ncbi:ankyrin repeat domain-containing protein [Kribbella sp. NPDC056951]|uniref:ankyrin repeat domain-containing protein n=1 Tax=Kribbella sp. NPDC056951 TaxID=3345978 RepID=UPI00362AD107
MKESDPYLRTELHYAALENDSRRLVSRLDNGDDIDAQDVQGFTALHLACQANAVEAARILLDRGASLSIVNRFGNTPLFVAVANSQGAGELITLLRERGADPRTVNKHGQTPVGLARLIANYNVEKFFADLPD